MKYLGTNKQSEVADNVKNNMYWSKLLYLNKQYIAQNNISFGTKHMHMQTLK